MPTLVGVKLRFAPRVLTYSVPDGVVVGSGDAVLVETERGAEIGEVVDGPTEVEKKPGSVRSLTRAATAEDLERVAELRAEERAAMPVLRELIGKHGLDMKPVAVELMFDGDKAVFYFSAEERVDFRELVRDLAARFKQRIDMRQVGVRDEARMVGGIGHCGEQLCCDRFSGDFQPVSIRMAKEQDLPLNPLKISGLCGRLMCCLRYEYDAYKDYKSRAPKRGAMIETPLGEGKVVDLNTPKETVTIRVPEVGAMTVPLGVMECGSGKGCPCVVKREALEEAHVPLPASMSSALERDSAPAEPARASERPPRTERRRSGGRGRDKAAEGGQQKQAEKGPAKREKPAEGATAQDAAKPKPSGRRRRRRRPGGGGSKEGGAQ